MESKPSGYEDSAPSWDALYELAASQQGCFTTEQAMEAGISAQLLQKHLKNGNLERLHRGIYRFVRFPATGRDQEDLVVVWLWSGRAGVFSHETALHLLDLSDAFPGHIHITLPLASKQRSLTPPPRVRVYFADLTPAECTFVGSVPVTAPARTIVDVANAHGDAGLIEAAARQALQRNAATLPMLLPAVEYLARGAGPPGPFKRATKDEDDER